MSVNRDELDRWLNNEESIGLYREGLEALKRSGILEFLRRMGTPEIIAYGGNPHIMAGQAHFAAGYQQALDHLVFFEKAFRQQAIPAMQSPDFGGIEAAIRRGDLRKEDIT